MTSTNSHTMIPIDDDVADGDIAVHRYMWTYAPSNRMLSYGTIGALVTAYAHAAYYGDGEDYSPLDVWALTVKGPDKVRMSFERSDSGVTIHTQWRLANPSGRGYRVMREQGWYAHPDN